MIKLSKWAKRDLESIFVYTFQTWGAEQAEKYQKAIQDKLLDIEMFPGMGTELETPIGTHKFVFSYSPQQRARKHVIVYRKNEDGIYVVRILHSKTNQKRD